MQVRAVKSGHFFPKRTPTTQSGQMNHLAVVGRVDRSGPNGTISNGALHRHSEVEYDSPPKASPRASKPV